MSTITEIAKANVKKDRTRSILIIISIALTTLLLTAVSGVLTKLRLLKHTCSCVQEHTHTYTVEAAKLRRHNRRQKGK